MIDAPDERRIIEFSKGISIGLKILIPIGGQITPNSIFGEILLWKKAQKNLRKNMISDRINMIILNFSKSIVGLVWCPWSDDSRFTSRHHMAAGNAIMAEVMVIRGIDRILAWKEAITEVAAERRIKDATIGHGLGETI